MCLSKASFTVFSADGCGGRERGKKNSTFPEALRYSTASLGRQFTGYDRLHMA